MAQEATQFEILDRVDVGGMAEIFRARNLANGEIMAIKRILPSLVGQKNFVNMFIDEAAVSMHLRHPNIVRVDQIGLMDKALFLSMEFVDGVNLRDLLSYANRNEDPIPIHDAIHIAIEVLNALEYAHNSCDDKGQPLHMIHRDVSPPNILLGYNGDVKITDFGLVKSKSQVSRTVPGLIKGKFSYLSPEAAYGESIDLRSDIYAVGIILWEMLTSQPLFNDPVEMKILDLVRKSIVPSIRSINPSVPEELEKIVMKGLARNRADRYQTAGEFEIELRAFILKMDYPPANIGVLVSKVKPQRREEEEILESAPAPEGATAADDDVLPHTRSEMIPIDMLRKAAGIDATGKEGSSKTESGGSADATDADKATMNSDADKSSSDADKLSSDKDTSSSDKDKSSSDADKLSSDKDTSSSDKDKSCSDKATSSSDKDKSSSYNGMNAKSDVVSRPEKSEKPYYSSRLESGDSVPKKKSLTREQIIIIVLFVLLCIVLSAIVLRSGH